MFVLSKNQFDQLTAGLSDRAWRSSGERARAAADATTTLLDLGAGDGRPTLAMSAGFDRVVATEVSQPMQRLLLACWPQRPRWGLPSTTCPPPG